MDKEEIVLRPGQVVFSIGSGGSLKASHFPDQAAGQLRFLASRKYEGRFPKVAKGAALAGFKEVFFVAPSDFFAGAKSLWTEWERKKDARGFENLKAAFPDDWERILKESEQGLKEKGGVKTSERLFPAMEKWFDCFIIASR